MSEQYIDSTIHDATIKVDKLLLNMHGMNIKTGYVCFISFSKFVLFLIFRFFIEAANQRRIFGPPVVVGIPQSEKPFCILLPSTTN